MVRNELLDWCLRNILLGLDILDWSRLLNKLLDWSRLDILDWSRLDILDWSRLLNKLLDWSRLDILDWSRLLNILDLLLLGGVNDLSFDCLILNSLLEAINRYVLGVLILVHLWVILGLVLNSVVISHYTFTGNLNDLADLLVFHDGLLVGHVLDTALSTNGLLGNYGLLHHRNGGNRLL